MDTWLFTTELVTVLLTIVVHVAVVEAAAAAGKPAATATHAIPAAHATTTLVAPLKPPSLKRATARPTRRLSSPTHAG
jgi:hypothetical protein